MMSSFSRFWVQGSSSLNQFDHFNNASSNIKFTYETTEKTSNIKFMETTTHISTAGVIPHELFMRPCHSGLIADYTSAVPQQQKLSVALSEFLRAARLSSNGETRRRSEQKVIDILEFNHYPHEFQIKLKNEPAVRDRTPQDKDLLIIVQPSNCHSR